jgi:protein-disulfide isomerase
MTLRKGHSMPSFRASAIAIAATLLLGAPVLAQSFSEPQRAEIETIVRSYLLAHPEVLEEVTAELSKRQTAAEDAKHTEAVQRNAELIFNSPRGVQVGHADGDVQFVEFFDYNCGYCKRAMSDMLTMIKDDPKLKVTLKEFPVLGPGSVEAAQVAVAARMQDPTGKKYLDFHQKLLGGRGPADKDKALAAAKDAGFDMARLEKDLKSPEVRATLEENFKVAEDVGLNGTPSYVIGQQVVVGAIGLDGLKEKVAMARCGKASC